MNAALCQSDFDLPRSEIWSVIKSGRLEMSLRIEKDGHVITTVEQWFTYAPPMKGALQWRDGRSAKELAKIFLETGVPATPPELCALLSSHQYLGTVDLEVATPEHKITLDNFKGETRNADLAAVGTGGIGRIAVTIEAKADEPFGDTIGENRSKGKANPKSNVPRRIAALAEAMFGHNGPEIDILRYQLLHASAASLIFAKEQKANAAVFVVLEFHGPSCLSDNLERNKGDFETFLKMLSLGALIPATGILNGPFFVQGGGFVPPYLPLFIGKSVRNLDK